MVYWVSRGMSSVAVPSDVVRGGPAGGVLGVPWYEQCCCTLRRGTRRARRWCTGCPVV